MEDLGSKHKNGRSFSLECCQTLGNNLHSSESRPALSPYRRPLWDVRHLTSRLQRYCTSHKVDMKLAFWSLQLLGNGTNQDQAYCHIRNCGRCTSPSCKHWSKIDSFDILMRSKEQKKTSMESSESIGSQHNTESACSAEFVIVSIEVRFKRKIKGNDRCLVILIPSS